jgi:hypothetical protein
MLGSSGFYATASERSRPATTCEDSGVPICPRNRVGVGSPPRAGAGRVLNSLGVTAGAISLPRPSRSRGWLDLAVLECRRCHQVVERHSPVQRHCPDCARALKRARSRDGMAQMRRPRAEPEGLPGRGIGCGRPRRRMVWSAGQARTSLRDGSPQTGRPDHRAGTAPRGQTDTVRLSRRQHSGEYEIARDDD